MQTAKRQKSNGCDEVQPKWRWRKPMSNNTQSAFLRVIKTRSPQMKHYYLKEGRRLKESKCHLQTFQYKMHMHLTAGQFVQSCSSECTNCAEQSCFSQPACLPAVQIVSVLCLCDSLASDWSENLPGNPILCVFFFSFQFLHMFRKYIFIKPFKYFTEVKIVSTHFEACSSQFLTNQAKPSSICF